MERISIFNYEAFYLDYLEGNLSEEDTQMLLQFLEEHPECRMEEDTLVTLDDVAPMTFSGKQSLKQVDESGPIAMDNVEHFMIADAEGLLDENKKSELDGVVADDRELEATRKDMRLYYTPDTSVVYSGKSRLKQRKSIVLWPYMSTAVAAAAVIAIMILPSDLVNIETFGVPGVDEIELASSGTEVDPGPGPAVDPANKGNNTNGFVRTASNSNSNTKEPVLPLNKMDSRKIRPLGDRAIDMTLRPVSADTYSNIGATEPNQSTYKAMTDDLAMENPIEPVTNFISEKAKTEVDFKRRKASKDKKGGFFLKIGKFEVSRNKH